MIQFPNKNMSVVENQIVERLVTDLLANSLSVSVWNGGDEPELADCTDLETIMAALAASDQDELTLRHGGTDGAYAGWVRLVWGNDHSVISDYTTRLEPQVKPASDLADDLEEGRAQIVGTLVEAVQPVEGVRETTTKMCIFWQSESARAYAAARWEYENGALSRTPAAQERAAEFAREVEIRLSQLVGY